MNALINEVWLDITSGPMATTLWLIGLLVMIGEIFDAVVLVPFTMYIDHRKAKEKAAKAEARARGESA